MRLSLILLPIIVANTNLLESWQKEVLFVFHLGFVDIKNLDLLEFSDPNRSINF